MPFLDHFGLETYPFGLTPDTDFYFPTKEGEGLLAALVFALTRGDGLLKITGEVGTGKTLTSRLLLARLDKAQINTAYVYAPAGLAPAQLPALIAKEFGLKLKDEAQAAEQLRAYLLKEHAKGRHNVLIIDEAQALGALGLESVRLLTNLETEKNKLLQIVLFGQPELDALLKGYGQRQITQRVSFHFDMKPLPTESVASYLDHRLARSAKRPPKTRKKAEGSAESLRLSFSARAAARLARVSGGTPRLIHQLADKALLAAYADGVHLIDLAHVRTACRETPGLSRWWWWV